LQQTYGAPGDGFGNKNPRGWRSSQRDEYAICENGRMFLSSSYGVLPRLAAPQLRVRRGIGKRVDVPSTFERTTDANVARVRHALVQLRLR